MAPKLKPSNWVKESSCDEYAEESYEKGGKGGKVGRSFALGVVVVGPPSVSSESESSAPSGAYSKLSAVGKLLEMSR